MQALDPVEVALARLMPPALSQSYQQELEALMDDLATGVVGVEKPLDSARPNHGRLWLAGSVAAAIALWCAVTPFTEKVSPPEQRVKSKLGFSLISESDQIRMVTDEGWHEDVDGSTSRAVSLSAVSENSMKDEASGMVVCISETREETILMPINSF